MLIGYARVSTADQTLDLQEDALEKAGCERIFTDTASGAQQERVGIDEAQLRKTPGDTLVVWRLDRLGRSPKHLIESITTLANRGIGFKSTLRSSFGSKRLYCSDAPVRRVGKLPSARPGKFGRGEGYMPGGPSWNPVTKRCRRVLVLATAFIGVASIAAPPVSAQVADVGGTADVQEEAPSQAWRFTVGLGAAVVPDYVGSDDYTLAALPKLRAEKGPYYADLTGPFLSSNVLQSRTWQLGPAGQFIKGDRCNSSDNTVNNMKCQSDAFMLGGQTAYNFILSDVSRISPKARLLFDVSGANDGYTFEPLLEYAQRLSNSWGLLLQSNVIIGSENYENYYFGVTGPQSRASGLKTYNADGGFQQFGFTAIGSYNVTDAVRLDLIGRYQRLVSDAANSPLVDGTNNSRGDANQFIFGALGTYTF